MNLSVSRSQKQLEWTDLQGYLCRQDQLILKVQLPVWKTCKTQLFQCDVCDSFTY